MVKTVVVQHAHVSILTPLRPQAVNAMNGLLTFLLSETHTFPDGLCEDWLDGCFTERRIGRVRLELGALVIVHL
ncbi:unnamed protein product [Ceratitis capitata]|uniref:(Mediterranean fruit fly) hypothetical protein n=1 Tax=Ceratitis capitata TaxID=7213 RepID=A0A811U057_CERCA|nr:unnamed protein product [Ceratitis capitata]